MSILLSVMLASMAPPVTLVKDEKTEEVEDKNKKICKRFAPPAGTRLRPRKICATKQEWAQRELQRDSEMDNFQNRTSLQSN